MKDNSGEIFTLDDVAAYLKVSKRTVYRLAASKKIPAFKVGGTWRFSRADIDAWIKQQSASGFEASIEHIGLAKSQPNNGEQK
jgi:excisionase family DNA binding protein